MIKKLGIKSIILWAGTLLAIVSMFLLFASGVTSSNVMRGMGLNGTYGPAYAFVFGGNMNIVTNYGTINTKLDCVSPLALVAWIILLVAVLAACVASFLAFKKNKLSGIIGLAAGVLMILAGIFFFCVLKQCINAIFGNELDAESISELISACNAKLGGGFISAGVVSIVAGLTCATPMVLGFIKK